MKLLNGNFGEYLFTVLQITDSCLLHEFDFRIFQVMYEEGEYFAKYNKIKFLETSAVTGENVQVSIIILFITSLEAVFMGYRKMTTMKIK